MDDRLAQVERGLERLIPRGFSEPGQASLEGLIDDLAGAEAAENAVPFVRSGIFFGAAAAISLAAGLAWWNAPEGSTAPGIARVDEAPMDPELMVEVENVVAVEEDAAMLADDDGGLHRAWRVTVVNEERFHDPATGHDVRVVHPRDELVLMPVTAF